MVYFQKNKSSLQALKYILTADNNYNFTFRRTCFRNVIKMKNLLLTSLLLVLLSSVTYAADNDLDKNNYYTIIKDRLNEKSEIINSFDELILSNEQNIHIQGCDFILQKTTKEKIYNELSNKKFFEDYHKELEKYHLSSNQFLKLYSIDKSNLSDECDQKDYTHIILLENNELMLPYSNNLVFFKKLKDEDKNKLDKFHRNQHCSETELNESDFSFKRICNYENMTILDVYDAMSFYPFYIFRNKLRVGKNFTTRYDYNNSRVEVKYKWTGKNKLAITQFFEGGDRYFIFVFKDNKTALTTIDCPD